MNSVQYFKRRSWLVFILLAVGTGHFREYCESSATTLNSSSASHIPATWDSNGYVFYCPCHGRFGNQADQFLGSLQFAADLNRTLVLPPWRVYSGPQKMVSFASLFKVEPLRAFHRVILAEDFVADLAEAHWPVSQRSAFCFKQTDDEEPCTTSNEFFEEFWKYVGIPAFHGSENIRGLLFDSTGAEDWKSRFPPDLYPVIALRGPPAPFPVPQSQWPLQRFLEWSSEISTEGSRHIAALFAGQPYLGIHLRTGSDWTKACALLDDDRHGLKNLMASSQCIGESPSAPVTKMQCFPTKQVVLQLVSQLVKEHELGHVYIASDADSYLHEFRQRFPSVKFVHLNPSLPQIDLYILERSEVFVGNCVSSFSSFVRRQRDVPGRKTVYFGLTVAQHNEL